MKSFDNSDIWTAVFNLYWVSLLAFKFSIKIQNVKHGYSISSLNNLYFNASANIDTRMRPRYNSQDYWRHCPSSWGEETWRLYLELQLGHWTLLPKPLLLRTSIRPTQKTTQACNRQILFVLMFLFHAIFKEQQSMDPKTPTELLLWYAFHQKEPKNWQKATSFQEGTHQNLTVLAPWSQTCGLQLCQK